MDYVDEFFGSADQINMMRRAETLWPLVKHHPYLGTHGRAVAVAPHAPDALAMVVALTKLVGVSACDGVAGDEVADWEAKLAAEGLKVDSYAKWQSAPDTLECATKIQHIQKLPDGMHCVVVDRETPAESLVALSNMMMDEAGVLLPNGRVMRGIDSESICLMAHDANHRPVASAGSVALFEKTNAEGSAAWWGLLATASKHRGKGLALRLGAEAMLKMNEKYGTTLFFTGIRDGNKPSEKLCSKLGMTNTGVRIIIAIDPNAFSNSQVTK